MQPDGILRYAKARKIFFPREINSYFYKLRPTPAPPLINVTGIVIFPITSIHQIVKKE